MSDHKTTRTLAMHLPADAASDLTLETSALTRATAGAGLQVHCPECRHTFDFQVDGDLKRLQCAACGRLIRIGGPDGEGSRERPIATVSHFELLDRVGMGGFGTVWKARDTRLDRIVALKLPRQGRLAPETIDELLHEARIAAQLTHPNIAGIYEIGRDEGRIYIVSEFMHGKSLDRWVEQRDLTHKDIASLSIKILDALQYAHDAGIVHRDLKPHNVLLDEAGEPHITDFGLAKRGAVDVARSLSGRILGTPAYMSPEQASGEAATADGRTDIYSFGVMLFQLLTDSLPFRGSARVLIDAALNQEPPRPRSLDSSIPVDLETICLKCLEKSPARRYPTSRAVADELRRFVNNEPIQARRIGNAARFGRWCRRNPVIPVLFGSLVAVMLVVFLSGWGLFEAAYRQTESSLTRQSLRGIGFATESVANTARRELEGWYELLEEIASKESIREPLAEFTDDRDLRQLVAELDDPSLAEVRRDELRQRLMESLPHQRLQKVLSDVHARTPGIFGWFVLGREGLQVARWPLNNTVGINYGWRSYFHGGEHDFADQAAYLASSRRRLERTSMSGAFVSQITDRWVICISTPVWRRLPGETSDEFLGVVALMFELGQITNLPGATSESEFAVLVDTRGDRVGAILQHPLFEQLRSPNERLPDHLQDHRVDLEGWQEMPGSHIAVKSQYRDPLGEDSLGTEYQDRWLAAKAPVLVRGEATGLWTIVQVRYDQQVGSALTSLREKVQWVAAASVALIITLVIPLWAIVLRRMKQT